MEYTEIEAGVYMVRIDKGHTLMTRLKEFIEAEEVQSAWVQGVGGASWVELGFYNLQEQTYSWERFDKPVEITGLTGNVAHEDNGSLFIHVHGTFSDASFHAIGGHVTDLEVAGTCELLVRTFDEQIVRTLDDQVGLKLLQLDHS